MTQIPEIAMSLISSLLIDCFTDGFRCRHSGLLSLPVLYLAQINKKRHGRRIQKKTVGLVHSGFPDVLNSRREIHGLRKIVYILHICPPNIQYAKGLRNSA